MHEQSHYTQPMMKTTIISGFNADRFDQLMDLYEQNYILVRRLLGDLRRLNTGDQFALNARINAQVTNRGPFTVEINFTDSHVLDKHNNPVQLCLRVYLDARSAELQGNDHPTRCLQREVELCNTERRSRNQLLNRWLQARVNGS